MSKLIFRYGAMGSGKTMALLQVAYNYNEKNMNVIIIKPKLDEKGGINIESRIGVSRQVDYIFPNKIKIRDKMQLDGISCILVDEAQFMSPHQIDELYEISKEEDIPVICYGLRTDFQSKGFPGANRLLEIADEIDELKTVCKCGKKATLNMRILNGNPVFKGDQVLIDGTDSCVEYTGVCGKCYLKYKKDYGEY
jgi:thymidine kinase